MADEGPPANEERIRELERISHQVVYLRNLTMMLSSTDEPLERLFNTLVHMVPEGWQHPDITCARLIHRDWDIKSVNFRETPWVLSANILVSGRSIGFLEVRYLEERPSRYEGPFFKDERDLLDTIAAEVGRFIERKQLENLKEQQRRELELYASLLRHDLRNDIGIVLGNIDLARMLIAEDNEELQESLSSSEAVCSRMMHLLGSFSRPEESIERNIASLLRDSSSQAQEAHIGLTVNFSADKNAGNLLIPGSRLLPMVFENLFRNASVHAGENWFQRRAAGLDSTCQSRL
jgi:signal transduction histidine kinase